MLEVKPSRRDEGGEGRKRKVRGKGEVTVKKQYVNGVSPPRPKRVQITMAQSQYKFVIVLHVNFRCSVRATLGGNGGGGSNERQ